jgi:hypothetical protein
VIDLDHFSPSEFTEPDKMQTHLLLALDETRKKACLPIYVTSSYREGDAKSHGRGWAVDIADNLEGKPCSSAWRFAVVRAALGSGFRRIGVYDLHCHLDCDPDLPPGVMWWGTSS